jgi:hypothetical protein
MRQGIDVSLTGRTVLDPRIVEEDLHGPPQGQLLLNQLLWRKILREFPSLVPEHTNTHLTRLRGEGSIIAGTTGCEHGHFHLSGFRFRRGQGPHIDQDPERSHPQIINVSSLQD